MLDSRAAAQSLVLPALLSFDSCICHSTCMLQGKKVMQMMVGSCRDHHHHQQQGSSADITSLPAPSDPAVRLSVAGGELVAVLPFEGYITPETAAAARQRLLRALEAGVLQLGGSCFAPCISCPVVFSSSSV
jgi:hypothetical protein